MPSLRRKDGRARGGPDMAACGAPVGGQHGGNLAQMRGGATRCQCVSFEARSSGVLPRVAQHWEAWTAWGPGRRDWVLPRGGADRRTLVRRCQRDVAAFQFHLALFDRLFLQNSELKCTE
jgi:hypothetical protein